MSYSIQNEDQLQLILIEFLESEPELFSNLFTSALYGNCFMFIIQTFFEYHSIPSIDPINAIRVNGMLETVLRNLYVALAENPKISNLKYVEPLSISLPGTYIL